MKLTRFIFLVPILTFSHLYLMAFQVLDEVEFDSLKINDCQVSIHSIRGATNDGNPIIQSIQGLNEIWRYEDEELTFGLGADKYEYFRSVSDDLPSLYDWELGVIELAQIGSKLCLGQTTIEVGGSISHLASLYPDSYNSKGLDALGEENILQLQITGKETSGIYMVYNPEELIIEKIVYFDVLN